MWNLQVFKRCAALTVMLGVMACETPVPPTIAELEDQWLGFLNPGETSREDILLTLGVPTSSFEDDRIVGYRLDLVEGRGFVPVDTALRGPHVLGLPGEFDLILVFDENAILMQHKLIAR